MAITLNGSGTITGVSSLATALVNPIVTTTMGVGNATPAASGAGITFPAAISASSDVNTLDDYEEGNFTAVATDGTVTKSGSGRYTKIGNMVSVTLGIIDIESPTGFTGTVYITGLPFSANASYYFPAAGWLNYLSTASNFSPAFSTTQVRFYRVGAATQDYVELNGTDTNAFTDIYVAGTYLV